MKKLGQIVIIGLVFWLGVIMFLEQCGSGKETESPSLPDTVYIIKKIPEKIADTIYRDSIRTRWIWRDKLVTVTITRPDSINKDSLTMSADVNCPEIYFHDTVTIKERPGIEFTMISGAGVLAPGIGYGFRNVRAGIQYDIIAGRPLVFFSCRLSKK